MYPLGPCERCGEPGRDRHHIDGDTGNNVPENISILCRRCHMKIDGRLERLIEIARAERPIVPGKPCSECGKIAKPLSRGLCHACYERARRRAIKAART